MASEPKLGGVSEETGRGGGYATTGVVRVRRFEFEPLRRAGSLGLRHSHPSVTVPGRSATWAAPEGQTFSAGEASWCLGVTAEAGFSRRSERADAFASEGFRQSLSSNIGRTDVPLA